MTERIIWQPKRIYQPSYEFIIHLDRQFAEEMLSAKVSRDRQDRMNVLALETMVRFGFNWPGPLSFHEDSALVTQFYIGQNGVWLATDSDSTRALLNREDTEDPVKYSSHNVDRVSQAHVLMALVDHWVEYADILKEK